MDKKLKNELFKVAVDYLFKEKKVGSQKELAEKIGITEPSLSRVMNGGRTVSDNTLHKMNDAFGGIFNMAYFRGEDPHCMLMEDLIYYKQHPEERFVFEKPNGDNPTQLEPKQASLHDSTLIMSKMYESMLKPIQDAHDKLVAALEKQIADKDAQIQQQADIIASLQKVISDLRALPSVSIEEIMNRHPFPIGVSESQESPRAQV